MFTTVPSPLESILSALDHEKESIREEKVANIYRSTLSISENSHARVVQDLVLIAHEDVSGNMIFSQVA